MSELPLFDQSRSEPIIPKFGGEVEPEDVPRLTKHLQRVLELMSDGKWRTLGEIADAVGCSETSSSARLRDLRKAWAGRYTVDKKRDEKVRGLYWYRVR